jgi:hypothetical protein
MDVDHAEATAIEADLAPRSLGTSQRRQGQTGSAYPQKVTTIRPVIPVPHMERSLLPWRPLQLAAAAKTAKDKT